MKETYTYEELIERANKSYTENKVLKFIVRNEKSDGFRRRDLEVKYETTDDKIYRYPIYIHFTLIDPIRKIFIKDTGSQTIVGEKDLLSLLSNPKQKIVITEVEEL